MAWRDWLRVGALFMAGVLLARGEARGEAGKIYVITGASAAAYLQPAEGPKADMVLGRGRRIEAVGPGENGFVPVMTRSGTRRLWIKESELAPEGGGAPKATKRKAAMGSRVRPLDSPARRTPSRVAETSWIKGLSFDLGLSAGSIGGVAYTELNLGLNAQIEDWLIWRNAIFARGPSPSFYGLDTSARLVWLGDVLSMHAGPGYRFVSTGPHAPFAEAGLSLRIPGLHFGVGLKTILNSLVQKNGVNDTQYFVLLAGGGGL